MRFFKHNKKAKLDIDPLAIEIGKRLMTVGVCDYCGQRISRDDDDYRSLFDDLILARHGLVEVNNEGIVHLTPRGIKTVNKLSKQIFETLEKA